MRILHHCLEYCFLYHRILPSYLVNISLTGAYCGVQCNICVEPFDISPPSNSACPHPTPSLPLLTGLIRALGNLREL